MGWKKEIAYDKGLTKQSQSAFAGYGLEGYVNLFETSFIFCRNPLSLDMGWKIDNQHFKIQLARRNPLSLDMGWKTAKYLFKYC